jgi:hypothetical protein
MILFLWVVLMRLDPTPEIHLKWGLSALDSLLPELQVVRQRDRYSQSVTVALCLPVCVRQGPEVCSGGPATMISAFRIP